MTRIFHACDIHGSEIVWNKIVKVGPYYKADIVMMCGDLTGKAIVPIVKRKESEWYCCPFGEEIVMRSRQEVEKFVQLQRNRGFYAFEITMKELEELQRNPKKLSDLFAKVMTETLARWIKMVEEKTPKDVRVIVNPGNDDVFEIDGVIRQSDRVIYPLQRVVKIDDVYEMITCEWANPTPWKTPRECSEKELGKKLEKEFSRVKGAENLICNFHAPPYNTSIDLAPKLKKDQTVVTSAGMPVMEHVGSKAVREFVEKHQPYLGLHGHIHESCGSTIIGRTLCLNPGSEYQSGILRGFIIDLPPKASEKAEYWRVEA